VPTNAVYGFTTMLLKALREASPPTWASPSTRRGAPSRQAIDPNYKANRPPPPEDLIPQFELVRAVVRALNVPVLEHKGYEADDVIATLVREAVEQGFRRAGDHRRQDFMQLVGEHVELYDSMSDRHTRLADVPERLGVRADQVVDYMSLVGDDVDNVPGVPKVGPKTASALIQKFGTAEELIARVKEVRRVHPGAKTLAERLEQNVEVIRRARQLVTLKADLQLDVAPKDLARRFLDEPAVRKLFGELEFTRLLRDLPPPPISEARAKITTSSTRRSSWRWSRA